MNVVGIYVPSQGRETHVAQGLWSDIRLETRGTFSAIEKVTQSKVAKARSQTHTPRE